MLERPQPHDGGMLAEEGKVGLLVWIVRFSIGVCDGGMLAQRRDD